MSDDLPAPDLSALFDAESHPRVGGPVLRLVVVAAGLLTGAVLVRRWGRRA